MTIDYKKCPICKSVLKYSRRAGEQIQKCATIGCKGSSSWLEEYEWEMFVDDNIKVETMKTEELMMNISVDRETLKAYGLIQAAIIHAKGMEAQNQWYIQEGQHPMYTQDDFWAVAEEIRKLSISLTSPENNKPQPQPIQYDTNVKTEDPC